MKLEMLLNGLENPHPAVRLDVVRVLGMLDETRALKRLRELYPKETDPSVRQAMAWAGTRLYEAEKAGYATLDALFEYFGVNREIEHMPDASEAELLRRLQDGFERDMLDFQARMNRRKLGMAAAAGLGGTLIGGAALGVVMMAGALRPGAETASASLGGERPQIGARRAPAMAPSDVDIQIWLRRLREGASTEQREQACIELAQLNNPRALPHLAAAFVGDSSPKVRQAAQRFGKILYWNGIYWDLEQSGALAREMALRANAIGKSFDAEQGEGDSTAMPGTIQQQDARQGPSPAAEPSPVDVGEILRKAQQARANRKRKR